MGSPFSTQVCVCVCVCRVKEKAYRELDDSDGRSDEVVAKEAWDYHLSRNRSIIVDLFQGQVPVCPAPYHVQIT